MTASAVLAVLDQVQNVGQVVEIGQAQVHQKEQVLWARRAYQLESQSVRLDVFDHVKEEIRSHHDTYMGRIDVLLLVLALIWPFALNAIQFSDPFIPQTEFECEHCIEVKHKWIVFVWMTLLGAILVLPFWGILMLIRCRLKLDAWLEYSLARLSQARRGMNITPQTKMGSTRNEDDEDDHDDTKDIVCRLVNMVAECQEYLGLMWTEECSWLVHTSTSLLWISAGAALLLTALSIWVFMVNKGGAHSKFGNWFAVIVSLGMAVPLVYMMRRSFDELEPPDEDMLASAAVSNPAMNEPATRRRRAQLLKGNSSPNFSRFFGDGTPKEEFTGESRFSNLRERIFDLLPSFKRMCGRRKQRRKKGEPLLRPT
ncbi:hypothetical protein AK812_SmicGene5658 [Symbiodinium microadriaticum]|uniref:Uncharacterized protein n=1 Tax=Symbiodinium microadriaticum TaxID=2951 RepID=A0A1Q9ET54_SYMMI|nr:hypothetical protein AK812_SmicGene5658 [Symbiodinium microadriaticum]CAE7215953.1 unnamed protein product [Symbiodinium microadriaticum]CAE7376662.1 unnamed protein product [Symbiodinium sp. KB8]